MSITEDVLELKQLDIELKRLRKQIRNLQSQKQKCEHRILEYLDVNEQPGVKMNDMVILAAHKKKRKYRKQKDRILNGSHILEKYGIHESKQVLDELIEAMRGSPERKPVLKIY